MIIKAAERFLWKEGITGIFYGSDPVLYDNLLEIFSTVPYDSVSNCKLTQQKYEMREEMKKWRK